MEIILPRILCQTALLKKSECISGADSCIVEVEGCYLLKVLKATSVTRSELAGSIMIAAAVLLIVFFAIDSARYGSLSADEGYYLLEISAPSNYPYSFRWFGWVYRPFYYFFGESVVVLRVFTILLNVLLTSWLAFLVMKSRASKVVQGHWSWFLLSAGVGVVGVTVQTATTVTTPSYNSLVIQGLLISILGATYVALRSSSDQRHLGIFLICLGGWLTFMAKPTSALVAFLAINAFLTVTRNCSLRIVGIQIIAVGGFVALVMFYIYGSLTEAVANVTVGLDFLRIMDTGHEPDAWMSMITRFVLARDDWVSLELVTISVALFFYGFIWARAFTHGRPFGILFNASLGIVLAGGVALLLERVPFTPEFQGLRFTFALAPLAVGLGLMVGNFRLKPQSVDRTMLALAFLLGFAPFLAWFGSNTIFHLWAPMGAVFWVLAGLSVAMINPDPPKSPEFFGIFVAVSVLSSSFVLSLASAYPYMSQSPLKQDAVAVEINRGSSVLLMDPVMGAYHRSLRDMAVEAQFLPGTPLIDLTGYQPGSVYALSGTPRLLHGL